MDTTLSEGYHFQGESLPLGISLIGEKAQSEAPVSIPLATLNRHGLIAGATGTGKTKTIQRIAEELSDHGISVLLMDIKGDLSGLAKPGTPNEKISERQKIIGTPWSPKGYPVELLSISDEPGVRIRATVDEFGPLLFSKMLELNENQEGIVTLLFKYCKDNNIPLIDLEDFKAALQYISKLNANQLSGYGFLSPASVGVIFRELLKLEEQGGDRLFGAPSFDVRDLLRKAPDGRGMIQILRLCDIQNKPKLFSTFMLCLLDEVYSKFPEVGDKEKPKLVLFIDEAHLIFQSATKTLLNRLETVVKLIRSKGVGVYFCTQVPGDVPDQILSQLGGKFQHALRAFTAKDRKEIKLVSQNYPTTTLYNTEELLTHLGIGEALVTVLNEKGNPTPLAHCMLSAPRSRMDLLTPDEIDEIVRNSLLGAIYNKQIPHEGALQKLKTPQEIPISNSDLEAALTKASKNPLVKSVVNTVVKSLMRLLTGK